MGGTNSAAVATASNRAANFIAAQSLAHKIVMLIRECHENSAMNLDNFGVRQYKYNRADVWQVLFKPFSNITAQNQRNYCTILRLNDEFGPIAAHNDSVSSLLKDLNGQVSEMFSRQDWYQKWGRFYLPSLALQQSTNFKDPGVQRYEIRKLENIRDSVENIFINVPSPKPSRTVSSYGTVRSMSAYYDSNAPWLAKGRAKFADGRLVDVSDVRAGDAVATSTGLCVFKTLC